MALTLSAAANSTSSAKPRPINSWPETDARRIAARSGTAARKASRATLASADNRIPRASRIAPAPRRSSTAGRRLPSAHCSPAGTTPIALSPAMARAAAATTAALRKHPVRTGIGLPANDSREPLGDGNKSLVPVGMSVRLGGDKLSHRPPAFRGPASTAPAAAAAVFAASGSPSGNGITEAPFATATSTAVENDSTSTITRTATRSRSASTPCRPHSQTACRILPSSMRRPNRDLVAREHPQREEGAR